MPRSIKIGWGVVAVIIILGVGYLIFIRPNAEAKKSCASLITYRPATEGAFGSGEYYTVATVGYGMQKFKTYEEAMEACLSNRNSGRGLLSEGD